MPGIDFSIPYNNDQETLDALLALNGRNGNRVREVFLSAPEFISSSGRILPSASPDDFAEVIGKAHAAGARVDVVLNAVCEGEGWYSRDYQRKLHRFLEWAIAEHGVEAVTFANPLYIRLVRKWFPDVEICASVLADIDCVERAKVVADAGADTYTPDVCINRDLEVLAHIHEATGMSCKLMVNEGCMHKCSFRKFHFNAVSHLGKATVRMERGAVTEEFKKSALGTDAGMFFGSCNGLLLEDPSLMLKSGWVRPEDLGEYGGVTGYFKISGRTIPREDLVPLVSAYMDESYEGNLLDVLDSSLRMMRIGHGAAIDNEKLGELKAFERLSSCKHECWNCSWCSNVAREVITFTK